MSKCQAELHYEIQKDIGIGLSHGRKVSDCINNSSFSRMQCISTIWRLCKTSYKKSSEMKSLEKVGLITYINTIEYQKSAQLKTRDCADFKILQISGH